MQVLDVQSLTDAMVKCHDNPRYKVEVLLSNHRDLKRIISINRSTPIQGIEQITENPSSGRVLFQNGSVVEFIPAESSYYSGIGRYFCSGIRCHDVLWDENLQAMYPAEVSQIANSILIKYHNEPLPVFQKPKDWTDDTETTEIDEFLSSFSIRK